MLELGTHVAHARGHFRFLCRASVVNEASFFPLPIEMQQYTPRKSLGLSIPSVKNSAAFTDLVCRYATRQATMAFHCPLREHSVVPRESMIG